VDASMADVCLLDSFENPQTVVDVQEKSHKHGVEISVNTFCCEDQCISVENTNDQSEIAESRNLSSSMVDQEDAARILGGDSAKDSDLGDFVINRMREVTVKAPVCVIGQSVRAVVDTGAEVTVVGHKVYEGMPVEKQPAMKSADQCLVNAKDGIKVECEDIMDTTVKTQDLHFDWPVHDVPVGDNILLGCNILVVKDATESTKGGFEGSEVMAEDNHCLVVAEDTQSQNSLLIEGCLQEGLYSVECREHVVDDMQGAGEEESHIHGVQDVKKYSEVSTDISENQVSLGKDSHESMKLVVEQCSVDPFQTDQLCSSPDGGEWKSVPEYTLVQRLAIIVKQSYDAGRTQKSHVPSAVDSWVSSILKMTTPWDPGRIT
jgi:hypothetical protein